MAADDFRDRRPRSARWAVAAVPGVRGGAQRRVRRLREVTLLQQMHVWTHGELGDEPDQIRREASVRRAGPDRGLIARERRAEQRSGFDRAAVDRLANVRGRFAGAAVRERVAQLT